ncbi:hypothetical protein TNCV_4954911 [Trichonephila clavipes]|nr:hypothetical protein TNCV_4954911 [Trichonephila clavipes]
MAKATQRCACENKGRSCVQGHDPVENQVVGPNCLRPDLVAQINNCIYIIDVTIPFENRRPSAKPVRGMYQIVTIYIQHLTGAQQYSTSASGHPNPPRTQERGSATAEQTDTQDSSASQLSNSTSAAATNCAVPCTPEISSSATAIVESDNVDNTVPSNLVTATNQGLCFATGDPAETATNEPSSPCGSATQSPCCMSWLNSKNSLISCG